MSFDEYVGHYAKTLAKTLSLREIIKFYGYYTKKSFNKVLLMNHSLVIAL